MSDTHVCYVCAKSLQLYPTLWGPMDCSPPGSSVRGILLARILEWVAMPSCRGFSQPRDRTHVSYVSCIGSQFLCRNYRHLGSNFQGQIDDPKQSISTKNSGVGTSLVVQWGRLCAPTATGRGSIPGP